MPATGTHRRCDEMNTNTTDRRTMDHLTPFERETVILMSDGDGVATVTTHQRTVLTKLERNPSAVKIEDLTHGSTAGARFEMPAHLISFRTRRVQRVYTDAEREAKAARMRELRATNVT